MYEENEPETADEIIGHYLIGVLPLEAWATSDLVALANAVDDEIERRSDEQ